MRHLRGLFPNVSCTLGNTRTFLYLETSKFLPVSFVLQHISNIIAPTSSCEASGWISFFPFSWNVPMSLLCVLNWIGPYIPSVASLLLAFQSLHQTNPSSCLLSRITHREPTLLSLGKFRLWVWLGRLTGIYIGWILLINVLTWSKHQDKCAEGPWYYTIAR